MAEEQDRHLQAPGEANRDKHINFVAIEEGDMDPSSEANTTNNQNLNDTTKTGGDNDFSLEGSNMQTPEEDKKDKGTNPTSQDKGKVQPSQTENEDAFPQQYTRSMTPEDIKSQENSNLHVKDDDNNK
ncbi:MAG: hypothetical protein ACTHJ5_18765 [Ilyomonas sp.]